MSAPPLSTPPLSASPLSASLPSAVPLSAPRLSEIELRLNSVGKDIWNSDMADQGDFNGILRKLDQLKEQIKVQRSLRETGNLLRNHPSDASLPNSQATRVRHFVKFVFERSIQPSEKCRRLRSLSCNALKFCGLSYTIKDITRLTSSRFDFLVDNVEDFIQQHNLVQHLYRHDIDKVMNGSFDPEDEDKFKDFLKSHIELRPTKRRHVESPEDPTADVQEDPVVVIGKAKSEPSHPGEETALSTSRQIQFMFSKPPANQIPLLGNVISDAIKTSSQWKMEGKLGESTTECLTVLIPSGENEDISVNIWVGRRKGLELLEMLKLQRTWSALPNHLLLQPHNQREPYTVQPL